MRPLAPVLFPVTVNQDGQLNSGVNPARRGSILVIYGTGLGATRTFGALSVTTNPVLASILGQDLPVMFSGLAPGFMGLYQINVQIPVTTPVGTRVLLVLGQGGLQTQPLEVAIQ